MAVLIPALVLLSLLGSGLMAGLFFAFSVAIMPALGTEPGPAAMAAMQRINVVIVRPLFLAVFVGTALVALAAAVVSLLDAGTATAWTLAGTALYLVAAIGLTSAYHVPRNNRLVAGDPTTTEGQALWETYLRGWTRWNHLRAAGCLLATAAFAVALRGS